MEQGLPLIQIHQIWKAITKSLIPYGEAKTTVEQLSQSEIQGKDTEWNEELNEVFCGGRTFFEKDCAIISELRTIKTELNRSHPGGFSD